MLLIACPWCGPRAESEFTCGGEADIARPLDTEKLRAHGVDQSIHCAVGNLLPLVAGSLDHDAAARQLLLDDPPHQLGFTDA